MRKAVKKSFWVNQHTFHSLEHPTLGPEVSGPQDPVYKTKHEDWAASCSMPAWLHNVLCEDEDTGIKRQQVLKRAAGQWRARDMTFSQSAWPYRDGLREDVRGGGPLPGKTRTQLPRWWWSWGWSVELAGAREGDGQYCKPWSSVSKKEWEMRLWGRKT